MSSYDGSEGVGCEDKKLSSGRPLVKLKVQKFYFGNQLTTIAVAYSSFPSRIISAIASRSGAGGRSSTSVGTRSRTVLCARINGGDEISGARKSIA